MKLYFILLLMGILFVPTLGGHRPWNKYRTDLYDKSDAVLGNPREKNDRVKKTYSRLSPKVSDTVDGSQFVPPILAGEIEFLIASEIWSEFQKDLPNLSVLSELQEMVEWIENEKKQYMIESDVDIGIRTAVYDKNEEPQNLLIPTDDYGRIDFNSSYFRDKNNLTIREIMNNVKTGKNKILQGGSYTNLMNVQDVSESLLAIKKELGNRTLDDLLASIDFLDLDLGPDPTPKVAFDYEFLKELLLNNHSEEIETTESTETATTQMPKPEAEAQADEIFEQIKQNFYNRPKRSFAESATEPMQEYEDGYENGNEHRYDYEYDDRNEYQNGGENRYDYEYEDRNEYQNGDEYEHEYRNEYQNGDEYEHEDRNGYQNGDEYEHEYKNEYQNGDEYEHEDRNEYQNEDEYEHEDENEYKNGNENQDINEDNNEDVFFETTIMVGIKKSISPKPCEYYKKYYNISSCYELLNQVIYDILNPLSNNQSLSNHIELAEEKFGRLLLKLNRDFNTSDLEQDSKLPDYNGSNDPLQVFFLNMPALNHTDAITYHEKIPLLLMVLDHKNKTAISVFVRKVQTMNHVLDEIVTQLADESDFYFFNLNSSEPNDIESNENITLEIDIEDENVKFELPVNLNENMVNHSVKYVISFIGNVNTSMELFETVSYMDAEEINRITNNKTSENLNVEYYNMVVNELTKHKEAIKNTHYRNVKQTMLKQLDYMNTTIVNCTMIRNMIIELKDLGEEDSTTGLLIMYVQLMDVFQEFLSDVTVNLFSVEEPETTNTVLSGVELKFKAKLNETERKYEQSLCESFIQNTNGYLDQNYITYWTRIVRKSRSKNLKDLVVSFYDSLTYLLGRLTNSVDELFIINEALDQITISNIEAFLNLEQEEYVSVHSGPIQNIIEHGIFLGTKRNNMLIGFPFELFTFEIQD